MLPVLHQPVLRDEFLVQPPERRPFGAERTEVHDLDAQSFVQRLEPHFRQGGQRFLVARLGDAPLNHFAADAPVARSSPSTATGRAVLPR
jgi:hypothetical protein